MKKLEIFFVLFITIIIFQSSLYTVSGAEKLLPAPTGIIVSASDSSIKISWDKVKGANAYRVYKYDNTSGKFKKYKKVSNTSCTISGLNKSTEYKFIVTALVKNGKKYKTQTKSAVYSIMTKKLPSPQNIHTKETAGVAETWIYWDILKGADAFRIYILNEKTGTYSIYKDEYTNHYSNMYFLVVKDLKGNSKYSFRIAALIANSDGTYSEQTLSDPFDVNINLTKKRLKTPKNIKYTLDSRTLTLTWNAVKGAESYTIRGRKNVLHNDKIYNTYLSDDEITTTGTSYTITLAQKEMFYFLEIYANPPENSNYRTSNSKSIIVKAK